MKSPNNKPIYWHVENLSEKLSSKFELFWQCRTEVMMSCFTCKFCNKHAKICKNNYIIRMKSPDNKLIYVYVVPLSKKLSSKFELIWQCGTEIMMSCFTWKFCKKYVRICKNNHNIRMKSPDNKSIYVHVAFYVKKLSSKFELIWQCTTEVMMICFTWKICNKHVRICNINHNIRMKSSDNKPIHVHVAFHLKKLPSKFELIWQCTTEVMMLWFTWKFCQKHVSIC